MYLHLKSERIASQILKQNLFPRAEHVFQNFRAKRMNVCTKNVKQENTMLQAGSESMLSVSLFHARWTNKKTIKKGTARRPT